MIGGAGKIAAALLLVLALALGGCGRKGDLRPPEGQEEAYPGRGVYPAPDSVVPQEGEASARPEHEEDPEAGEEGAGGP